MKSFVISVATVLLTLPPLRANGDERLAPAIHSVLETGFQQARADEKALQSAFQSAVRTLGSEHPYLDYAFSVVLRKNFHAKEGDERLQLAATSTSPPVFLAREELILDHLKRGRYQDALMSLEELAEQIAQTPEESTFAADARRSAGWIGGVLAYLEGPLGNQEVKKLARLKESRIARHLGQTYGGMYQTGRLKTSLRHQELLDSVKDKKEIVQEEKQELAAQSQEQVEKFKEQQAAFEERFQDFQDVATDSLSEIDSKLSVLEQQFATSLETERTMTITSTGIRLEIQRLRQEADATSQGISANTGRFNRFQRIDLIDQQIALLERELIILTNDYALLLESRNNLIQVAKQMMARRQQLVGQVQAAANSAQAEQQRLNRMQQQITQMEEKASSSLEVDPKVIAQVRKVKAYTSYERRTVQDERDLLLQVFQNSKRD